MNPIIIYTHPPRDWQVFQNLVADIARVKYVEHSVQEYGRVGQRQDGVDVFAEDYSGKRIGLQCKETKQKELNKTDITEECEKAVRFKPALDYFTICTTLMTDAKAQAEVNNLNSNNKYSFKIQIWFWDQINLDINRSSKLLFSLYPAYACEFGADDQKKHLAAIRSAFDRPAFRDNFIHERNYDDFEEALSSTKQLLRTGLLFDRLSKQLIAQVIPTDMIGDVEYRKFVAMIEKKLESIYQKYIKNKYEILRDYNQADNYAGYFNLQRKQLVEMINKKFAEKKITEISIYY